jgi:hypothetical protein
MEFPHRGGIYILNPLFGVWVFNYNNLLRYPRILELEYLYENGS